MAGSQSQRPQGSGWGFLVSSFFLHVVCLAHLVSSNTWARRQGAGQPALGTPPPMPSADFPPTSSLKWAHNSHAHSSLRSLSRALRFLGQHQEGIWPVGRWAALLYAAPLPCPGLGLFFTGAFTPWRLHPPQRSFLD